MKPKISLFSNRAAGISSAITFNRAILLAVFCFPLLNASGDVEISVSEDVTGVTVSWDGSIDTAGLTPDGNLTAVSTGIDPSSGIFDGEGHSSVSPNTSIYLFSVNVPAFSFGTGNFSAGGDVASASSFMVEAGNDEIGLPLGYVSGTNFSGSLFYSGQTISSLGIDTTFFEVVLPDGAGSVFFFPNSVDTTAPLLRITRPSKTFRYKRRLTVKGTSSEPLTSLQAKWTGSGFKNIPAVTSWKVKVPKKTLLKKRAVTVSVRGTDASGNTSSIVKQRYKKRR